MKKPISLVAAILAGGFAGAEDSATPVGGVVPGLPTYSLEMPSSEPNTDGSPYWDALSVFDGDAATKMDDYAYFGSGAARGVVGLDAGTPRHVTGMRIRQSSGYGDRNQSVKLLGSNDGENWTTVVANNGTVVGADDFTTLSAIADVGRFRYFRIADSVVNDLTDVEIISDDALIKADAPQSWADASVNAADAAEGVLVSGTLVYSPGEATVVAYAALRDYGDDFASWRKYGTELSVGTFASGATFSARFVGLKAGRYYWRLFATVAGATSASEMTRPFVVGSSFYAAPMYMNTSEWWNAYDGSLDSFADNKDCSWFVFDCSAIAERLQPCSLRFWPRTDSRRVWNRVRGLKVEVSFDAHLEPNEWKGAYNDWAGRPKYTNATEPDGLIWQSVGTGEIFTDPMSGVEEFVLPKFDKNPTYIRVRDIYWGNVCEVELRTVKRPSGFAIIIR